MSEILSEHHLIVIPPDNRLTEIVHSDKPIDIRAWLVKANYEQFGAIGEYVALTLWPHEPEQGQVHFLAYSGNENQRAREVLARLTDVHIRLTGNVIFTGLSEARTFEIVGALQ